MTSKTITNSPGMGEGATHHKVLITDCDFSQGDAERSVLGDGFTVGFLGSRDPDAITAAARDVDGLFVQWAQITEDMMDRMSALRGIVRYGIGLDNIDLAAAAARGIEVRNVDDYCIDEVADHAVLCILAANRRVVEADRRVKSGGWSSVDEFSPLPPGDDPVGIVGMGRIGRAVAGRLRILGYPVSYFDPLMPEDRLRAEHRVDASQRGSLENLADNANHISLHVPLLPETIGLADATLFERLGRKGHLVNTSRGGLVNEADLINALDRGVIRWASLDVFGEEPPVVGTSKALAHHPRVLSTPHMAYLSTASLRRLPLHAAARMRSALQ